MELVVGLGLSTLGLPILKATAQGVGILLEAAHAPHLLLLLLLLLPSALPLCVSGVRVGVQACACHAAASHTEVAVRRAPWGHAIPGRHLTICHLCRCACLGRSWHCMDCSSHMVGAARQALCTISISRPGPPLLLGWVAVGAGAAEGGARRTCLKHWRLGLAVWAAVPCCHARCNSVSWAGAAAQSSAVRPGCS